MDETKEEIDPTKMIETSANEEVKVLEEEYEQDKSEQGYTYYDYDQGYYYDPNYDPSYEEGYLYPQAEEQEQNDEQHRTRYRHKFSHQFR